MFSFHPEDFFFDLIHLTLEDVLKDHNNFLLGFLRDGKNHKLRSFKIRINLMTYTNVDSRRLFTDRCYAQHGSCYII